MTEEGPYTDIERCLLQFIISTGSISVEVLQNSIFVKFKKGIEENQEEGIERTAEEEIILGRSLETSIDLINHKLHLIGYRIVRVISEVSYEPYYVYINTISDEPSKISTTSTPKEINIVKQMIDHIISDSDDESFAITERDALKLCASEGLTSSQGLYFLSTLINEGWLNETKNSRYYLSIRALTELKPMLVKKYGIKTLDPDTDGLLNSCSGCKEIVTIGVRCNNDTCNVRFHRRCQEYFARAHGSKCPNPHCDVDWANVTPSIVGVSRT